ncbi:MAG: DMT family transporter [Deltaproteobacteria bacterium]|nr:DMT family transporter [Deltaproteobacteria bacterium]
MTIRDNTIASTGKAFLWTALGVLGFSGSLPATRAAVAGLEPATVGLGRAVVAAALAASALLATRSRLPPWRLVPRLALVAACVVVGFPLLSALALREVAASHAAVVVAIAPLATALFAVALAGERPPRRFWVASTVGAGAVLVYVATSAGLGPADLTLAGAALVVALGYAEGGRLARELGGWRVIAWALVIASPVALALTPWPADPAAVPASAWLGFAYVSVVSMFLGFVAWYTGLARGGIARMGQLQLLQPFLTLVWAALLLGEEPGPGAFLAVLVVVGAIAASARRGAGSRGGGQGSQPRIPARTAPRAGGYPSADGGCP